MLLTSERRGQGKHSKIDSRGDSWMNQKTDKNHLENYQEWNGIASNSFLVGIESDYLSSEAGTPLNLWGRKGDRTYSFLTARSNNFVLDQCSGWRKLNNLTQDFDLMLEGNEVIAAIKSDYKHGRRIIRFGDREFSVITCKIRRIGKISPLYLQQEN